MTATNCTTLLLALLAGWPSLAQAVTEDPLRVFVSGASAAAVYVTPQGGAAEPGEGEVSLATFAPKFYKGKTPLELKLAPGQYLVSVLPTMSWTMRDATLAVREYVWDGFDYHALVFQPDTGRWRCAHCYAIEKKAGQPLTVFAVFTGPTSPGECATFTASGGPATRFLGTEQEALAQLGDAGVPTAYSDDLLAAVSEGRKVILRIGATCYAVSVLWPDRLLIREGHGAGNWAGHRLEICAGE